MERATSLPRIRTASGTVRACLVSLIAFGARVARVLTREHVTHGERDDHGRHEELVGRRVQDAPEDGAHVEPPGEPAIELCGVSREKFSSIANMTLVERDKRARIRTRSDTPATNSNPVAVAKSPLRM